MNISDLEVSLMSVLCDITDADVLIILTQWEGGRYKVPEPNTYKLKIFIKYKSKNSIKCEPRNRFVDTDCIAD